MNKLDRLFENKKQNLLSVYFTAGYPRLEDTTAILEALQQAGADMVEIGMPFSDPLADGPVIQQSSEIALQNGMSVSTLFRQLMDSKTKLQNKKCPLVLMGYLNPVLQFGVEEFCKKASEAGIDGVILPDLPVQEYLDEYQAMFRKYKLCNIFLITPQTSDERIRKIDEASDSFIYVVSSASTTGTKNGTEGSESYFNRIRQMKLKSPLMIGFGISDKASFFKACEYASGAIIGSAFIRALKGSADPAAATKQFIQSIRS